MYYTIDMAETKLRTLQARVPEALYEEVEERIELGLYASVSEIVREALRKMIASQSRSFLIDLTAKSGISKEEMLKELKRVRYGSP